ncbi:hypothetical protein AB0J83_05300 [Actinoplanes sp. NPDC049596]|uniref:mechanosensitive ion channel family protein n=1 Tax=unclassified Actinoplanes TaxID=2626549 RepID=UPI003431D548
MSRGLEDMWRSVLLFIPTALGFIAIVVIGYVAARLLRTLTARVLARAGLDRSRFFRDRITPSVLCSKIVFYGVLLFALQLAFGLWGPNPVSDLLTAVIAWLPRAFIAVVIIVVAVAIGRAAADLITSALGPLPYARLLARAVSTVIITLGVIAALDQVQIATSVTQPLLIAVLATVAGVVIVGVGGGLIRPMQARWETWLDRAATESTTIRDQARAYAATRPSPSDPPATPEPVRPETATPAADETQVIPPPRSSPPASAAPASSASAASAAPAASTSADETVTIVTSGDEDTTIIRPGANDTVVIGNSPDETQVIAPSDATATRPLPTDPDDRRP